jgi:hypothetical protein
MEHYLFNRYNLTVDTASDCLDVLEKFCGSVERYEMVILDEEVNGLAAASHVFKLIKEQKEQTSVMFRSTIKEVTGRYKNEAFSLSPEYADKNFRLKQSNRRLDDVNNMVYPVIQSSSMEDIYQNVCDGLIKHFEVDYAVMAINRTDQKPVRDATMVWNSPGLIDDIPMKFDIHHSTHLDTMVRYYRPIHFPHLDENIDKTFIRDLDERFSLSFGSALLAPMVFDGTSIGFIGMFTGRAGRLYDLVDLDNILRLVDFTAVAVIAMFAQTHLNMKIGITQARQASAFPGAADRLL